MLDQENGHTPEGDAVMNPPTVKPPQVTGSYSWPLKGGVVIEITVRGGRLTPLHVDAVKQYLEIAKGQLDDAAPPRPTPFSIPFEADSSREAAE
jgi:hypothetical protein